MKMKKGLLAGLLATLMFGAVSFPVEVPEAVANQGSSCTKSNTLSKRVGFADLHRARKILGHKDPWANQLSDFDLGARQKRQSQRACTSSSALPPTRAWIGRPRRKPVGRLWSTS
jgi:hypothetical protein